MELPISHEPTLGHIAGFHFQKKGFKRPDCAVFDNVLACLQLRTMCVCDESPGVWHS